MNALVLSIAALTAGVAAQSPYKVVVGGLDATGNPKLVFDPPFVNAKKGDKITFEFHQKNHSVVQTSFGNVCHPLLNDQYQPAFETQFFPVANTDTTFPTTDYIVEDDTKPLWFFCSQQGHCGKGMVFSINCPSGDAPNSLQNFVNSALAFGQQEAAGASWSATATSEVYGGATYAPVYAPAVTETISLDSTSVWTTTYNSYANSPNATPVSAEGTVHEVVVGGNNGLTYDPPSVAAAPRDTIRFKFVTKNHTVTQSSFGAPCRKLEFTSTTGQVGFDSGFIPGAADNSPTFEIKVNDTAPIWVYCRQSGHCGNGMVFSVNADESSDRNFAAFQALAKTLNGTGSSNTNTGNGYGGAGFVNTPALGAVAASVFLGLGVVVNFML